MAGELPGANIFAVMMQAPSELMSLAARQATETMGLLSIGAQTLGAELATPPNIAGLALPPIPGMPATQAAPPAAAQAFTPFAQKKLDIVI